MMRQSEESGMQANRFLPALVMGAAALCQAAALSYPPRMEGAIEEVYKNAGGTDLKIYIFNPPGHSATQRRPAIVFFFGGGWSSGSPAQFENQCRYLASLGMVAMTADYRVKNRQGVAAVECVRDAKSAIRWVRQNAGRLGVDPNHIAAGGGSAGGHLAAAAGVIDGLDEPGENLKISSRPNALVLFNPALVLAPVAGESNAKFPDLRERAGVDPVQISPWHHVRKGAPPTIIFHGKADTTVPYATAEMFASKMKDAGNRCELVGFEGAAHGFFNFGRQGSQGYRETLRRAAEFLQSLGYLSRVTPVP